MALTVTPSLASSTPSARTSPCSPAFDATYDAMVGRAIWPMIDDTTMMRPERCLTISRAASRARRNPAVRSVSMTVCQSASLVSRSGLRTMIPALLTRMSRRSRRAIAAPVAAPSATSKGRMPALAPPARSSAARASSVSGWRPLSSSSAPAAASAWAIAQPSPREAPVTSATLPARLKSGDLSAMASDLARRGRSRGDRRLDHRIIMRRRQKPGAALEGAHAAAQQCGGKGDVALLVDAGEGAIIVRLLRCTECHVEDLWEAGDARRYAGIAQGAAQPLHQTAAATLEIGEHGGVGELLQSRGGR